MKPTMSARPGLAHLEIDPVGAGRRRARDSPRAETKAADAVAKLKEEPGEDILIYGSGQLVGTLMQHDLIDLYRPMLSPPALARGRRFFRDGSEKTMLALSDAKTTQTGVVVLTYQSTAESS
jgi:dihydrofolate reductase